MAKTKNSPPKDAATKKKSTAKAKTASAPKKGGGTSESRILEAIAGQIALGNDKANRTIVQGLAAIASSGSFGTTILNMKKKKGLVEYNKDSIWLTEKGLETVGPDAVAKPQNNDAMQDKLKENLKSKQSHKIFDLLADGNGYTRQELAKKMGLEDNKSFGTYVSHLSKVVDREGGKIRLKQIAFPCGRPCDQ